MHSHWHHFEYGVNTCCGIQVKTHRLALTNSLVNRVAGEPKTWSQGLKYCSWIQVTASRQWSCGATIVMETMNMSCGQSRQLWLPKFISHPDKQYEFASFLQQKVWPSCKEELWIPHSVSTLSTSKVKVGFQEDYSSFSFSSENAVLMCILKFLFLLPQPAPTWAG